MALAFDDQQATALLATLGLPATTTDPSTVVATVTDALEATDIATAAPSVIVAAAAKAGLEAVDADTLAALRHEAAEGRQIKATLERERITAAVDDAVSKGKITPARREHWVNLISADPGMGEVLAKVPDGTAVPISEIGYSSEADGSGDDSWDW